MTRTPFEQILAGERQLPKEELLRLDRAPSELPKLPSGIEALTYHTVAGWETEAARRAILSNLWNGANWRELYIYGGSGKALRHWAAFDETMAVLQQLRGNETLMMQSGVPYGVAYTHPLAPRVVITNSIIVPDFANANAFPQFVNAGLTDLSYCTLKKDKK